MGGVDMTEAKTKVRFLEDYGSYTEGETAWLDDATASLLIDDRICTPAEKALPRPNKHRMVTGRRSITK